MTGFDAISGRTDTVRWMLRLPLDTLRDVRTYDCGPTAYRVLCAMVADAWTGPIAEDATVQEMLRALARRARKEQV